MFSRLEYFPIEILEVICDFLEGHSIHTLLLCGSKRLSASTRLSVRRFGFQLTQIENFPFYAFGFALPIEISVKIDSMGRSYPVLCDRRQLLPSKPIKSLKKLEYHFSQSLSILGDGAGLSEIFPNLTHLSLKRGHFEVSNAHLMALPSTLCRLELEASGSSRTSVAPISLTVLVKISQNLELLRLKSFNIVLETDEASQRLEFSDSILDLALSSVLGTHLLRKLPRRVEHVDIGFSLGNPVSPEIPISVLPATLRTFIISTCARKARLVVDAPFPPRLEAWNALANWNALPSNFVLPATLTDILCPIDLFGMNLESVPKALKVLDVSDIYLEEVHVQNFPPTLWELFLGPASPKSLTSLPQTLGSLCIMSVPEVGILTSGVCERLNSLQILDCSLHHLESASCLRGFKRLETLLLGVEQDFLSNEETLFSHLPVETVDHVQLDISTDSAVFWPMWLVQLQSCKRLRSLTCTLERYCGNDSLPLYLKCLPSSLTELNVPPIPHSKSISLEKEDPLLSTPEFLDCFHHFPNKLASLCFGVPALDPAANDRVPIRLSDECFTHLPPSLTHLNLLNVTGITDRFWNVLPPHIGEFRFLPQTLNQSPSFPSLHDEYLAKFAMPE